MCCENNCSFRLCFSFYLFKPPSVRDPHTCESKLTGDLNGQLNSSQICSIPEIITLVKSAKRNATVKDMKQILSNLGFHSSYSVLRRSLKKLKKRMFLSDTEQYRLVDSYVEKMNEKGHYSVVEKESCGAFLRLCVIFKEGINGFGMYFQRGMQCDATFLRILAVAIVSTENENNWSWFLGFIKQKIVKSPAFIISDREKGLINAVRLFENVHHAYCFRHVLENFQLRFKNKVLKEKAWGLAKSSTKDEFDKVENHMRSINPDAIDWLKSIGYDKLTLLHSPMCKYGTCTSNNVESVNSRLLEIRKLPVLELLLAIERMVVLDRFSSFKEAQKWNGNLTKYAKKCLKENLRKGKNFFIFQTEDNDFLLNYLSKENNFKVNISDGGSCTSGLFEQYRFPCEHLSIVLHTNKKDPELFMCDTWKKETYIAANLEIGLSSSVSIMEELKEGFANPPISIKKRGRPRMKRFASQGVDMVQKKINVQNVVVLDILERHAKIN